MATIADQLRQEVASVYAKIASELTDRVVSEIREHGCANVSMSSLVKGAKVEDGRYPQYGVYIDKRLEPVFVEDFRKKGFVVRHSIYWVNTYDVKL